MRMILAFFVGIVNTIGYTVGGLLLIYLNKFQTFIEAFAG